MPTDTRKRKLLARKMQSLTARGFDPGKTTVAQLAELAGGMVVDDLVEMVQQERSRIICEEMNRAPAPESAPE